MANIKITELNAAGSLAANDVLPVVDISTDETKKITATNLFRTLPDGTAAAPSLGFGSDPANGIFLAYDTTDTQEFFAAGYWQDNGTTNQDNIVLFTRGVDGTWGSFFNDSTTNHMLYYSGTSLSVLSTNVETGAYYNVFIAKGGSPGIGDGARFVSANPRLLCPVANSTGSYYADGAYAVYSTGYQAPAVVLG